MFGNCQAIHVTYQMAQIGLQRFLVIGQPGTTAEQATNVAARAIATAESILGIHQAMLDPASSLR